VRSRAFVVGLLGNQDQAQVRRGCPPPNFEVDFNKPPTMSLLVAIRSQEGKRTPKMMKWGLIPHWAKDDKIQYSTHNARSEEFTSKPAFREAWRRDP
jgi:putative SOS response-associated peptidase YedK